MVERPRVASRGIISGAQVDTSHSVFCVPAETARPAATSFARRLTALFDAAESRVKFLQEQARMRFLERKERIQRFCNLAGRIQSLLLSRRAEFQSVRALSDVIQNESRERRHEDDATVHGLTTVMAVPVSPTRPISMEFSLHIGSDGPGEYVVLDYRLNILPIVVSFDSNDHLTVPMPGADDTVITKWSERHLTAFANTCYEAYFHEQYQWPTLTMDPVLNVRLPKAMVMSVEECCGRQYYFHTGESHRRFRLHTESYTGDSAA